MNSLCIRKRIGEHMHELYHIDDGDAWDIHLGETIAWRIAFHNEPMDLNTKEDTSKLYWIPR